MPSTIVYHEAMPLGDEASRDLLLAAALGESRRSAELAEVIAAGRTPSSSDAAVLELARRLGTESPDLLQRLREHQAVTAANRAAYDVARKSNPDAVFYPSRVDADRAPRDLAHELPFAAVSKIVDRGTPIGSAGSCFAVEIALELQRRGFDYVVTEPDPDGPAGLSQFPARWGLMFNTPSLRQLVERAFGDRDTPPLLWACPGEDGVHYRDPFREHVFFSSVEEYEADRPRHLEAAREALRRAEVFVVTLGVNEIWRLKSDGSVLARVPWGTGMPLVERHVMTVDENVAELERMLTLWRRENPGIRLIVTVSPVPLKATFRGDESHVVAANCHSKSVLRVAAERFCATHDGVDYFPSYETVLSCSRDPWRPDQRHVTRDTVARVFELFDTMFVRDAASTAAARLRRRMESGDAPETTCRFVLAPDWTGDEAEVAGAFVRAFGGADGVELLVLGPAGEGPELAAAGDTLRRAGADAEGAPDVVLIGDPGGAGLGEVVAGADAVIMSGSRRELDLLAAARQAGVVAVEADPRVWREVRGVVLEATGVDRVLAELASRAGPEVRPALHDVRRGLAVHLESGRTPSVAAATFAELLRAPGLAARVRSVLTAAWPARAGGPSARARTDGEPTAADLARCARRVPCRPAPETGELAAAVDDLIEDPTIAALVTAPSVVAEAREQLGGEPILASASLRVRTPGPGAAASACAGGALRGRVVRSAALEDGREVTVAADYVLTFFATDHRPRRLPPVLDARRQDLRTWAPRLLVGFF